MLDKLARDFLILLATIDPIGTLSIFLGATAGLSSVQARRIAVRAIIYSTAILVGFLVIGQILLELLDIRMAAFQLAGGIILFLFGTQMIFGTGAMGSGPPTKEHDAAVFPLAVPSIASPGAILAVTLLTDNDQFGLLTQMATAAALLTVLGLTLLLMLAARHIHRWIGTQGAQVLVRLLGMILAALAIEMALDGILALVAEHQST